MKTKAETDAEILTGAARANNEISEVRTRHSESVHPVDCACELCLQTRFNKKSPDEVLAELDWDVS